jgi:hypothetical protein
MENGTKVKWCLVVLMVLLMASPAFAGGKVRALNIFPYTLETESIPLYPENIEQLCITDVEGTICENGELVPAVGNGVNFVPASGNGATGTPPTYSNVELVWHHHSGDYDYYTSVAGTVATFTGGLFQPKACVKDGAYWKCDEIGCKAIAVVASGGSCIANAITQATCEENPITPATLGPVAFQEGTVQLACPNIGDVPTQDVEYKQLVTRACIGDTISVEATGYTWAERTVKYRIVVRYFKPGKPNFTVLLRTDRETVLINGFFYDSLEGGFTFEKAGTYAFIFWVIKPDGTRGSARSRTVVVPELCVEETPTE